MCGGSKLPPKRATSGIEEKPQTIPREGFALRVPESTELRHGCALIGPGPERGAAGEQIDGRFVVDELVLLRPPAELRRILRPGVDDGGDAEADGIEAARILDVDLHAVAALPLVLVPGGSERGGAEADTFEALAAEIVGEPPRIEPGRTEELERPGGATAFREIGSLEQTHPWVDERGLRRRHVRGRHHPGKSRLDKMEVSTPVLQGDDPQVAADPLVDQARVFAGGQAVAGADRPEADERLESGVDDASLDGQPADGIGPV